MKELQLSQSVLQRRVFNPDIYKLHSTDFMLGQTKKWLSKDKVTLDIGGAAGLYSTYFAERSKHVYAFEAVPPVFKQLNKLSLQFDNFTCYNVAVNDFDGKSTFWVDDKRLSNSGFQNLVDGQPIEIDVRKIDSYNIEDVGFIKVDVEGNEYDVLNGAIKTIDKYNPTCMIECYPKFSKHPCEMIYNFFADRGYNCAYNKKGIGLEEVKSVEEFNNSLPLIEVHDGDYIFYHGNIPE
tara:strand:+ start:2506 stop:3216 length:711 start_codon:yes stop_codon:yes gene_type:complete